MSPQEIRTALDRATKTVAARPSVGQRVYVNTAIVEDGLACRIVEKDHVLTADLPPSMGGANAGPSPSVLLRAALSSCVAMGVKMWAARMDLPVDRVAVRVETDVDARGQFGVCADIAPGFGAVRIHVDVSSSADPVRVREAVVASLHYSPLVDVFHKPQAMQTQVEITCPAEGGG